MLEITTRARSRELVTLAEVKARLGITDSSEDVAIATWIATSSDAIERYVRYELALQHYREDLAGHGERLLYLGRRPIDPDSITVRIRGEEVTDWVVATAAEAGLFRACWWPCNAGPSWSSEGVPLLDADFRAGYVLPGWIAGWQAATEYGLGDWVRPTDPQSSPYLFEATSAGTSHAANEPEWASLVPGDTVVDGTVTWTTRQVEELPEILETCAFLTVSHFRANPEAAAGVTSRRAGEFQESYSGAQADELLPVQVLRSLKGFRR